jgi:CRISPR-associated protein Cas2
MEKELLAEGGFMVVMILERVPTVLRGELSRWLTPVGGGVHVGQISALVREELWKLALNKAGNGRVIQIWSCRGEPGYGLRVHGLVDASLVDLEGLPMIAVRDAAWRQAMERFTGKAPDSSIAEAAGDLGPC